MVNPWAAMILLIGLGVIVVGVKGNEYNLIAAVMGRAYNGKYGSSTLK
jgi:hypothetical protein